MQVIISVFPVEALLPRLQTLARLPQQAITLHTTLNNSQGNNFGISSRGTITTLTNTGTISAAGNNIGIFNTGIITTLNNSQGASGSALTYDGTLPTNYNIIVNSPSDYGQVVFSNVSGTTNFGVDSSSTLANDTTYSSVLSGLISSDIASGISGTFVPSNACSDVSGTTMTISANCALRWSHLFGQFGSEVKVYSAC